MNPPDHQKTVSGKKIVVAMFLFGFLATGILWTYWQLHLMPFMPLQQSLANEFEESSPRVEGGRRKLNQETPMILRVVMRVPFDPTTDDPQIQQSIDARLERTKQLATLHTEPDEYQVLEVHLYQEMQEQHLAQKTFFKDLAVVRAD